MLRRQHNTHRERETEWGPAGWGVAFGHWSWICRNGEGWVKFGFLRGPKWAFADQADNLEREWVTWAALRENLK